MTQRSTQAVAVAIALGVTMLVLAKAPPARAESLADAFAAGNEAYFQGDYATAIERYRFLEEAGVRDADVAFNFATAYARSGDLGRAVLYFERALWLRPGDDAAEEGLDAARALLARRRADREGTAELRLEPPLADALVRPFSAEALAYAAVIANALMFALLGAFSAVRRTGVRLAVGVAIPVAGLVLLCSGTGLLVKVGALREGEPAVVLREGAELREGPDASAKPRGRAHEGELASALEQDGKHVRVQLESGARGWIAAGDRGRLRPH